MFIGFVRTCNTIQLGYKYLISQIQSVSNIGKCLQVDTTTTVHPSRRQSHSCRDGPASTMLNRRHVQGIEGIEGKAIAVGMDRPVPWKSPVEHGGAWFRNGGTPAGLKPKAVPEACAEMLSK